MIQKFSFTEFDFNSYVITPFCNTDDRGSFTKDYSLEEFIKNGINFDLKEVFYTKSKKGVIRAMHFQHTKEQPKLVRCIYGKVFDVVADVRINSPTFGKWFSIILSDDNNQEILVPAGCAHGYLVLEDSIISYKCSEKFYSEYDDGVIWNDQILNIPWPLDLIGGKEKLIISDRDRELQTLMEYKEIHSKEL